LLRHKKAVSKLTEMAEGSSFHRVLWDDAEINPALTSTKLKSDDQIRRVIMCSGKVYYDLLEDREKRGIDDVYLLRLEQQPSKLLELLASLRRLCGEASLRRLKRPVQKRSGLHLSAACR
jgi:2-oxoglutarate dehydrogenase E1 component